MTDDAVVWELGERLLKMARRHGLSAFDDEAYRWRFDVPVSAWEGCRSYGARHYGWAAPERPNGSWHLFGYPIRVDERLPDDAVRLVRMA